MATVAFTIHSHYDPEDRERLEIETGQVPSGVTNTTKLPNQPPLDDPEEQWKREASQIYKRPSLAASAPRFVPAKIADGEWDSYATTPTLASTLKGEKKGDVAGWYRTLTASSSASASPSPAPGPSRSSHIERPSSAPIPTSTQRPHIAGPSTSVTAPKPQEKFDKNNWFIQNVIDSTTSRSNASTPGTSIVSTHTPFSIAAEPSTSASSTPAPPPSLADILKRDPPPTASDPKFKPPVWVALGPGNKGFGMLRKGGWNEGEALGPYAVRRKGKEEIDVSALLGDLESEEAVGANARGTANSGSMNGKAATAVKVEYVEVPMAKGGKRKRRRAEEGWEDDDEITELKKVEVVDLTLESDESDGDVDPAASHEPSSSKARIKTEEKEVDSPTNELDDEASSEDEGSEEEEGQDDASAYPDGHGGTALLTPISTILKTDRLGIGLKPKLTSSAATKGAYRVPVLKDTRRNQAYVASKGFRVTSTQGVLDEIRWREQQEKRDREIWGRGKRGKERKRRKEEADRKDLLAYMNT